MDKFGIFNLLNSLFTTYQQKLSNSNDNSETSNSSSFNGIFTKPTPTDNETKPQEQLLSLKPLQSGMLSTLRTHDEFVKRVYKNNQTKKS